LTGALHSSWGCVANRDSSDHLTVPRPVEVPQTFGWAVMSTGAHLNIPVHMTTTFWRGHGGVEF
jgi:hypothetical protein